MNSVKLLTVLGAIAACQACISLLDNKWKPRSLETRARVAQVVVSTRTLSTFPIPTKSRARLYGATFEVLSILKGWAELEELLEKGGPAVQERDKLIITALGFGDRRQCWSSVNVGETYILFLGINQLKGNLVAKYLGEFGAAELLYASHEDAILSSLGWRPWSTWSTCSKSCGGGIRRRTRICSAKDICHGPRMESKRCNTFTCVGSVNVLKSIENENMNTRQRKQFREGILHSDGHSFAPNAMTYLLFPEHFPSEFSILVRFKAAIYLPHYIFTLYDANNRMLIGLKVGPGVITFHYGGQNDVTSDRVTHSFAADFMEDVWHQIGVSVSSSLLTVTEGCALIGKVELRTKQSDSFDIFGAVYIGADENEGTSRNFPGQISQLTIVPDPSAIVQQCGKRLFFASQRMARQPSPPYLGGPSVRAREMQTDSSGSDQIDVDQEKGGEDDRGSGQEIVICTAKCLNGGRCVNKTECSCPSGWSGKDCGQAVCNPPCEHGGVCTSPGVCKCTTRYGGQHCQKAICTPNCLNGGICTAIRFECKCLNGFFGKSCQHRVCRRYITRRVSYLRPVTKAKIIEYKVPCGVLGIWKCSKARIVYYKVQDTFYRQEYVCAK